MSCIYVSILVTSTVMQDHTWINRPNSLEQACGCSCTHCKCSNVQNTNVHCKCKQCLWSKILLWCTYKYRTVDWSQLYVGTYLGSYIKPLAKQLTHHNRTYTHIRINSELVCCLHRLKVPLLHPWKHATSEPLLGSNYRTLMVITIIICYKYCCVCI